MPHVQKEMISFFVTTKCNLACSYCYTNKEKLEYKNQTIDINFARAGIKDYFASNNSRHIRYFGAGEPTTEFDIMKEIYEYAEYIAKNDLTSEIQTNGVFSAKIAEWLAKHIDIIWISSDGYPEIQNKYRRTINNEPTSHFIENNINYLIHNSKGVVGIRTTITDDTIKKQKDIVDYFDSIGIKYIWNDPIFPGVGKKYEYGTFDYMLYAKEFIVANRYAYEKGIFYGSFLTCNFDSRTNYHCRACIPVPHLTSDGYVSACDMALFGKADKSEMHMDKFIYGSWNKAKNKIEYNEEKIKLLRNRSGDNMPGCKNCPALRYCAGYCLGEVTNETGDLFGKKPYICEPIIYLLKNMPKEFVKYRYLHP